MYKRDSMTRREFVYLSAATAATAGLLSVSGCVSGKRGSVTPRALAPQPDLLNRETFAKLAQVAFQETSADGVLIKVHQAESKWCKYAAGEITHWETDPQPILQITVVSGDQVGWATAEFTAESVKAGVHDAEAAMRDTDTAPLLAALSDTPRYLVLPTYRESTGRASRDRREEVLAGLASLIKDAGMRTEGNLHAMVEAVGVAASTGLMAFEWRTTAEYRMAAAAEGVTIPLNGAHRSLDDLVCPQTIRAELERAKITQIAEAPAAGSPIILGPRAVTGLLTPLLAVLDACDGQGGAAPIARQIGQQMFDSRLTLRSRPDHPDLLGTSFTPTGAATNALPWIKDGILRRVSTHPAVEGHVHFDGQWCKHAWHLAGDEPAANDLSRLIASCDDGLLVTDIGDVWPVDPATGTSMYIAARAYRVQAGKLIGRVKDVRWTAASLTPFNRVRAFSKPLEVTVRSGMPGPSPLTAGLAKLLVPALCVEDLRDSGAA